MNRRLRGERSISGQVNSRGAAHIRQCCPVGHSPSYFVHSKCLLTCSITSAALGASGGYAGCRGDRRISKMAIGSLSVLSPTGTGANTPPVNKGIEIMTALSVLFPFCFIMTKYVLPSSLVRCAPRRSAISATQALLVDGFPTTTILNLSLLIRLSLYP
jgi:hypothetical protein